MSLKARRGATGFSEVMDFAFRAPVRLGLASLALLLFSAGAGAAQPRLSQNATWGHTLAAWRCSPCHAIGDDAASPNPRAPRFVDLVQRFSPAGLERRLTGFAGDRHDVMPPRELTTDEALFIAAYIESLRPRGGAPRP